MADAGGGRFERLRAAARVYTSTVLALATILGLYVGARAVHLTWLFVAAVIAGVPAAAVWYLRPVVLESFRRLRDYGSCATRGSAHG